jgi:hypothetical protein
MSASQSARIAELERLVRQREFEIEFLKRALQTLDEVRGRAAAPRERTAKR